MPRAVKKDATSGEPVVKSENKVTEKKSAKEKPVEGTEKKSAKEKPVKVAEKKLAKETPVEVTDTDKNVIVKKRTVPKYQYVVIESSVHKIGGKYNSANSKKAAIKSASRQRACEEASLKDDDDPIYIKLEDNDGRHTFYSLTCKPLAKPMESTIKGKVVSKSIDHFAVQMTQSEYEEATLKSVVKSPRRAATRKAAAKSA